ncbi:MAG: hypothetical protein ACE5LU_23875 [Anaerolineae bacterium]
MTVRSYTPERLRDVELKLGRDDAGDLIFERRVRYRKGKYVRRGRPPSTEIGFLAIRQVKEVEAMVREVATREPSVSSPDPDWVHQPSSETGDSRYQAEDQRGTYVLGCSQVLAGLMVPVFVMTAVLALFSVNLAQVLTDREAIKQMLDAETLMVNVVSLGILDQAGAEESIALNPDSAIVKAAISELFPPGWIVTQRDAVIDAVFDFLETGDPAATRFEIDVRPVLDRLRGEPGRRAVLVGLQLLPTCAEPRPDVDLEADPFNIGNCLPPNVAVSEIARRQHTAIVEIVDEDPDLREGTGPVPVSLLNEDTMTPETRESLQRLRQFFLLTQRAWLLWLIPIGCLLLMSLLGVRSFSGLGLWWGWSLLIAAVISLVLVAQIPTVLTAAVQSADININADDMLVESVTPFIRYLLDTLIDLWLTRVSRQAGFMLIWGIILVAAGFVARVAGRSERTAWQQP